MMGFRFLGLVFRGSESHIGIPWPFRRPILFLQSSAGLESRGFAFLDPALPQAPNTTTDRQTARILHPQAE